MTPPPGRGGTRRAADDCAERLARLAEVLVDVDDRIAAEDAAAAKAEHDGPVRDD